MRIALYAAVTLLAFPAAASAGVARPPLPDPMPEVIIGECPGLEGEVAGCYFAPGEGDVRGGVYPGGAVFTLTSDRFTTLHELGRAFDGQRMDAGERNRFATLLDRTDEVWSSNYTDEQGRVIQDPRSLAGVFGNAYANCRMGHIVASGHTWEAGYDYFPTAAQHRAICKMIAHAGEDSGEPVAADGFR